MINIKSSLFLFALSSLLFVACGSPGGSTETLSQDVQVALKETLMDEYKAEAIYNKIISKLGNVKPFSNIVNAETKHSKSLEKLYATYKLTIPKNPWKESTDSLPVYASLKEACKAGVQAEIDNIAIYDRFFKDLTLPKNVNTVFTSLRNASRDKHLPAFKRCAQ